MATLTSSRPQSPSWPRRRPRSWALRCERTCCLVASYFPLAFVYGVTTWAVYVEASLGLQSPSPSAWIGYHSTIVGVALYLLLNASYTVAVFTDPGSPLSGRSTGNSSGGNGRQHQYSALPVTERAEYTAYTVNSTGGSRYCKKCQCPKPDRTHHCSTCKRCVLKMDHHCPWLATCVGLYNYKAFLLFLIYTSVFCWVCFVVAGLWVWDEIAQDAQYLESFLPVNVVLLAIIGGIIGLVLTGFTGWHISLAVRGMTTIECLEKTRYVSPLRKALDRHGRAEALYPNGGGGGGGDGFANENGRANGHESRGSLSHRLQDYGHQIIDAHANAIPGVTRAEEGEERVSPTPENFPRNRPQDHVSPYFDHSNGTGRGPGSANVGLTPAQEALQRSYAYLERQRERNQYREYQDEEDNEKLPRAFDLGWRRNLLHLFGPQPLLWPFPVCTTTGDGWHWEASAKFFEARERLRQKREQELANEQDYYRDLYQRNMDNGRSWLGEHHLQQHQHQHQQHQTSWNHTGPPDAPVYDRERPTSGVSMKTLRPMSPRPRPGDSDYDDGGGDAIPSGNQHRPSRAEADASTNESVEGERVRSTPRRMRIRADEESDEWRDWE